MFGQGAVDKSWETSSGEKRAGAAKAANDIRARVREWIDAGKTDSQIRDELIALSSGTTVVTAFNPLAGFVGNEVVATVRTLDVMPRDIRTRFQV